MTTNPDQPRALLSPDGKLLAWRTGAKHFQWRATDGYDREPEDVADWTPLVPSPVSPVAEDTGLRERIAEALTWTPYEDVEGHRAEVLDVVVPLLAGITAERDALSRMLRGMARRVGAMRYDCQDNHDSAETYRYERDLAREQRDQYSRNWDYSRQVNEQAAETIAASEQEIARLRAGV